MLGAADQFRFVYQTLNGDGEIAVRVTVVQNNDAWAKAGVAGSAPRWVRQRRAGNVFTSSVSMDGSTWTQVGTETIAMGAAAYVGLAVSYHNNAQLTTVTLESVSVR